MTKDKETNPGQSRNQQQPPKVEKPKKPIQDHPEDQNSG